MHVSVRVGITYPPAHGLAADIESGRASAASDDGYTDDIELMLENSRLFYAALYRRRRIHIGC